MSTPAPRSCPATATPIRDGAFGNAVELVCRECRATQPLGPFYACQECFGPLEVGYDFPRGHPRADRGRPQEHLALPAAAAGAGRHHRRARTWSPASPG